jgi:hypothetical protein
MGKRDDKEWLFKLARTMQKPAEEGPEAPTGIQPPDSKPPREPRFKRQDAGIPAGAAFAVAAMTELPVWLRIVFLPRAQFA